MLRNAASIFCLFAIFVAAQVSHAQEQTVIVSGVVADADGVSIPYASVYVRETLTGIATDNSGHYSIALPADATLHIVVQCIGYKTAEQVVSTQQSRTCNFELETADIMLGEVVAVGNEDPAYGIMRKAIVNAPLHLYAVSDYTAEIYMKGTGQFHNVPKYVAKRFGISLDEDRVYTMESLNKIEFRSPNEFRQTVISEQSSIPLDFLSEDFRLKYLNINLYDVHDDAVIISPLSKNAFYYYKFVYLGYSESFGQIINHIKVIPRRNPRQCFAGTLQIVEGSWQIAFVDLTLEVAIGTISVVQNFVPLGHDTWLPVMNKYTLDVELFDFTANVNYIGVANYSDINFSEAKNRMAVAAEIGTDTLAEVLGSESRARKFRCNTQKLEEVLDKEVLSNTDVRRTARRWQRQTTLADTTSQRLEIKNRLNYILVDTIAEVKQQSEWDALRPIALTTEEAAGFVASWAEAADTMRVARQKENKSSVLPMILGNAVIPLDSGIYLKLSGIGPEFISYHPATGFAFEESANIYFKQQNSLYSLGFRLAYACGTKQFMPEVSGSVKFGIHHLAAAVGEAYSDWKDPVGDSRITNSLTCFFFKLNYKKLIQKQYAYIAYSSSPVWGLDVEGSIRHEEITPISNVVQFSVFKNYKRFGENVPWNKRIDNDEVISDAKQVVVAMKASYTPRLRYYTDNNGRRIPQGSRWPTMTMSLEHGTAFINEGRSNFTHLSAEIERKKAFSLADKFNWSIGGGKIFNPENASFANWKHFTGSNKIFALADLSAGYSGFVTFHPYELSTKDWYLYLTAHYQTQSLILKKLPIFSRGLNTEELFLKCAHISGDDTYTEIGYGLGHIFLVLRMTVFASFINEEFHSAYFRAAISLSDLMKAKK